MIESVNKAIKLINIVSHPQNNIPTLKYISETLNINKSSCCHLIKTLIDNDILIKISASKGYELGPRAFYWTNNKTYLEIDLSIIKPILHWLHKETTESVVVSTIINNKKYILLYYSSDITIISDGSSLFEEQFYKSATGMHLLSTLNTQDLYNVYKNNPLPDKNIWPNINSFTNLLNLLKTIRRKHVYKFVFCDENNTLIFSYSCLIKKNGQIWGAVGITLNSKKIEGPNAEADIVKKLTTAASLISKRFDKYSKDS